MVNINTESSLLNLRYKKIVSKEEMSSLMEFGISSFKAEAKTVEDLKSLRDMESALDDLRTEEYSPVVMIADVDVSYSGSAIIRLKSFQGDVVVSVFSVIFNIGDISSLRDYLMLKNVTTDNALMAVAVNMAASKFEKAVLTLNLDIKSGVGSDKMTLRKSISELAVSAKADGDVAAAVLVDVANNPGRFSTVELLNKTNHTVLQMVQSLSVDDFDLVVDGKSRPELLKEAYSNYVKIRAARLKK